MKEIFFNWLSGLGVEVTAMMALVIALSFIVLTAFYCAGLVAASGTIADWMQTPRIRKRLDTLTGLVLVGFGVRLATES